MHDIVVVLMRCSVAATASLHNTDLHLVAHTLEQKLPLKGDQFAFLGSLERPHQCLVVIRNIVVVKQLTERCVGLAFYPDAPNVHQQLGALFVQTALKLAIK